MAPHPLHHPGDRAPALVALLWERSGVLPRNMIFVEVTHPKVPYIRDNRYHVTVFDRDGDKGSIIGVELRFGFMEEPNVERFLEDMARHKQIDLPSDPGQWIVHVAHENLLPARSMNVLRRLRFRLVPVPAPGFAARLLRLWPGRRSAAFRGNHAGQGAVGLRWKRPPPRSLRAKRSNPAIEAAGGSRVGATEEPLG